MTPEPTAQSTPFPRLLGSYGGHAAGPLVLSIGGMHGNEPAGVLALQQVLGSLHASNLPFRGRFVGLAGNRAALARGCRYIDQDFNRLWSPERVQQLKRQERSADTGAEDAEQRELLEELEAQLARRHGPVVFLDLHTTSAAGRPFVVIGDTLLNRRFAFRLRAAMILGLEEQLEGTLLNYLSERGHVAIGFEAGQHAAPSAVENHVAAIWSVLVTAGCIPTTAVPASSERRPAVVEIRHHHLIQDGDGFVMQPGFTNFQPVRRGQLLAHDRHGPIRAAESGQILMPLYQGQGADGFFVVRAVRPVWLGLAAWLRRLRLERFLPVLPGVRRHPDLAATFTIDLRIARWYGLELFHLLGFRKKRSQAGKLIVSRRWHEPGAFEEWTAPESVNTHEDQTCMSKT